MQRLYVKDCRSYITAEQVVDGVPINPVLPAGFDNTSNDERPASHQKFWYVPFIVIDTVEEHDAYANDRTDEYADEGRDLWFGSGEGRKKWMEAYPSGARYDVRCLDGGAWDRSTCKGSFDSLELAVGYAKAIR